jgi:hypothetical protein
MNGIACSSNRARRTAGSGFELAFGLDSVIADESSSPSVRERSIETGRSRRAIDMRAPLGSVG